MQNVTFAVVATDEGSPEPFATTMDVTFTIINPSNNFNPELDQSSYLATLSENASTNSLVLVFTVSDSDVGEASEIGQAILLGADAEFFTVVLTGPNSGEIRSKYVCTFVVVVVVVAAVTVAVATVAASVVVAATVAVSVVVAAIVAVSVVVAATVAVSVVVAAIVAVSVVVAAIVAVSVEQQQ